MEKAIEHYHRGIELWNKGLPKEAVVEFELALQQDSFVAGIPYEEGVSRAREGSFADAEAWLWVALLFRPEHSPTLSCLGDVLRRLGQVDEALPLLEKAVTVAPSSWQAYSDLSLALRDLDRLDDAASALEAAVRISGLNAPLASNLASVRKSQGRFDEAMELLEEALRLQPDLQAAHVNRAHLLLLHGRVEEGWEEYEWRPQKRIPEDRVLRDQPLDGKTVLVHQEQGLGDLVQFVRYAEKLSAAGGQVIVSCDDKLIPLIRCARGVADAVSRNGPPPACDYEVNIMSLPRILGADPWAEVPYFDIDPLITAEWSRRMEGERRFRVGLVWGGNPANPVDRMRSVKLAQLAPLLRQSGAAFYSLQLGPQREELAMLTSDLQIADLQTECTGIVDVAAAMMHLDLVISVDTMPAHLAGALGRPVWVLLPLVPDWRWMLGRDDSPWYPSARLFRQKRAGDWDGVVTELLAALASQVQ